MLGMTGFQTAFVLVVAIICLAATITSIVSHIGNTMRKTAEAKAASRIGAWRPLPTDDEIRHAERVRMGVQKEEGDPTR